MMALIRQFKALKAVLMASKAMPCRVSRSAVLLRVLVPRNDSCWFHATCVVFPQHEADFSGFCYVRF
jgi:hypothetical protein